MTRTRFFIYFCIGNVKSLVVRIWQSLLRELLFGRVVDHDCTEYQVGQKGLCSSRLSYKILWLKSQFSNVFGFNEFLSPPCNVKDAQLPYKSNEMPRHRSSNRKCFDFGVICSLS